ncbi:MAG: YkgJ family cysteine cluster protein [Phycisphaerae bacterium]|nr:YkgJ family cysteine cluster protein [Phycisphaerae bacterium]
MNTKMTKATPTKAILKKTIRVTDACKKCNGKCCRYFALPIETPEDWDDYDDIRWYLCHRDVTVFVEDGEWYLNIKNTCRYLSEEDFRCQNYELRPHICRKYHTDDCDLTGDDYGYELHFTNDRQMEEYMRIKFGDKVFEKLEPKKKKKKAKKKKVK